MQPLAGHSQALVLDPFVQKPPVSTGCDHFEMSPDESAGQVVGWSSGVDSNSSAENIFQSQTETFWCLQSLNLCEGRKEWRREGKHWDTPRWHRIKTWLSSSVCQNFHGKPFISSPFPPSKPPVRLWPETWTFQVGMALAVRSGWNDYSCIKRNPLLNYAKGEMVSGNNFYQGWNRGEWCDKLSAQVRNHLRPSPASRTAWGQFILDGFSSVSPLMPTHL